MRIELSNGRQFIIKLSYTKTYKSTCKKDEWGREIFTSWIERGTVCTIEELFKKKKHSGILYIGRSHCHYMDRFDKIVGRGKAYFNAITEMANQGVLSEPEFNEMFKFELNAQVKSMKKEAENG